MKKRNEDTGQFQQQEDRVDRFIRETNERRGSSSPVKRKQGDRVDEFIRKTNAKRSSDA